MTTQTSKCTFSASPTIYNLCSQYLELSMIGSTDGKPQQKSWLSRSIFGALDKHVEIICPYILDSQSSLQLWNFLVTSHPGISQGWSCLALRVQPWSSRYSLHMLPAWIKIYFFPGLRLKKRTMDPEKKPFYWGSNEREGLDSVMQLCWADLDFL